MAEKIRFELNYAGVGQLLRSEEMQAGIRSIVDQIADGDDQPETYVYGTRAVGEVHGSNAENRLLKRMMGAKE